jgi:hypothetical protein
VVESVLMAVAFLAMLLVRPGLGSGVRGVGREGGRGCEVERDAIGSKGYVPVSGQQPGGVARAGLRPRSGLQVGRCLRQESGLSSGSVADACGPNWTWDSGRPREGRPREDGPSRPGVTCKGTRDPTQGCGLEGVA